MKKFIAFCLLAVFLTACSTVGTTVTSTFTNRTLLTKIVVAEVLANNPTWAPIAYEISSGILYVVDDATGASLDDLEALAREELTQYDLTPGSIILANELITAVKTGLVAEFDRVGVLNESERVSRALKFIRWFADVTRQPG